MVSRASHCHHTPHAFRAHNGPVMSPSSPKSTVSSAAATARWSAARRCLNKYTALAMPQTNADVNMTIHEGTWK